MSENCVRISLSVCKAPVPAAYQIECQSILMPTDPREASVLGWLIWSTYVHQLALRNASLSDPPQVGEFKDDFIFTEAARNSEVGPVEMQCLKHQRKDLFEAWWGGKKNLSRWKGKRWLVIMFPWDMGDVDILDAAFVPVGDLFTMPTFESQSCNEIASALSHGAHPFTSVVPEPVVESMVDENDRLSDGDLEIEDGDSIIQEIAGDMQEGSGRRRAVMESFREMVDQLVQTYPALASLREPSSCSGDESSQGDADDFM